jgi:hypothetical protein
LISTFTNTSTNHDFAYKRGLTQLSNVAQPKQTRIKGQPIDKLLEVLNKQALIHSPVKEKGCSGRKRVSVADGRSKDSISSINLNVSSRWLHYRIRIISASEG